jgi:hypothetical protein
VAQLSTLGDFARTVKTTELIHHSRTLTADEWRAMFVTLPEFFRSITSPAAILGAEYGFGCEIHPDLQFIPMRVGIGWFDRFLRDSVAQRIFLPGSSDMSIFEPEKRLIVDFCHEGDIHVRGSDSALVARFISDERYASLFPVA